MPIIPTPKVLETPFLGPFCEEVFRTVTALPKATFLNRLLCVWITHPFGRGDEPVQDVQKLYVDRQLSKGYKLCWNPRKQDTPLRLAVAIVKPRVKWR
jgi:hypothetical protein